MNCLRHQKWHISTLDGPMPLFRCNASLHNTELVCTCRWHVSFIYCNVSVWTGVLFGLMYEWIASTIGNDTYLPQVNQCHYSNAMHNTQLACTYGWHISYICYNVHAWTEGPFGLIYRWIASGISNDTTQPRPILKLHFLSSNMLT